MARLTRLLDAMDPIRLAFKELPNGATVAANPNGDAKHFSNRSQANKCAADLAGVGYAVRVTQFCGRPFYVVVESGPSGR